VAEEQASPVAGNGSALEEGKLLRLRTISGLALSVLFLAIATFAVAEEGPIPSGKIAMQTKSLAFGVGVRWGEGTLSYAGRDFRFSVNGLTMLDFGIATASAVGEIYQLADLGLFEGTISRAKLGLHWVVGWGGS
jgi:hypothetical protein